MKKKSSQKLRGTRANQDSTETIEASLVKDFPLNLGLTIPKQDLYWRGCLVLKAVEYDARPLPIPDGIRAEILWDVFEQGFRIELLATDRCIFPRSVMLLADANARDAFVSQVFSSGSPVNTSISEESLGARRTAFRATYLNKFCRVVQTWGEAGAPLKEAKFQNIDKTSNPTVIDDVERLAFGIYCTTFFRYFGRAPTVPYIFPTHGA